ncbi:MAG TPA: hypothetical protein VML54_14335 [Candidatus Limnocylindrales bacterium]|nr:hypothetical protein [Candidatus Limnocylindrales bacterium]
MAEIVALLDFGSNAARFLLTRVRPGVGFEILHEVLDVQLADTVKARIIRPDGRSERLPPSGAPVLRAQDRLYELTGASGASSPVKASIVAPAP